MNTSFPAPFDVLVDVALSEEIELKELPQALFGPRLKPETWVDNVPQVLPVRVSEHLPTAVSGARMEGTPVLFGVIAGEPTFETMKDSLRRYRNQATIARSWLDVDATNLQLFLAAPLDSAESSEWQEIAAIIEADDRVCRKLVWLPSASSVRESAKAFLSRTFLASPWNSTPVRDSVSLDAISSIRLPDGWDILVHDSSLDADSLVVRLSEVSDE